MNKFKIFRFVRLNKVIPLAILICVLLLVASPVEAHHPMGGKTPSNFFEGFLSGIAHPLIGLDHLAFIVAVGLIAVTKKQGILIPITFILATMVGTGLHLTKLDLPGVELFVSGSVMLFGILLTLKDSPNITIMTGLSVVAGLFHGYAYGEAIFGSEMTPLIAYLAGFTVIQLVVALCAFWIGKTTLVNANKPTFEKLRSAGLVISGMGLAFFIPQVLDLIFPVPSA